MLGSFIFIRSNLLDKALSLAINLLYSFVVVAPITFIFPRAKYGFKISLAFIAPSAPPAFDNV
jgi:hypothetical protein